MCGTRDEGTRRYLLRGMARCGFCGRKMHGAVIRKHETYYRCLARSLAPGSEALAEHPRTVNLREADVLEPLNTWIGRLFAPANVDRTVAALLGSQAEPSTRSGPKDALKKKLTDATTRLRRLQAAVEAGADPAALVDAINTAQAERAAAQAELDGAPDARTLTDGEIYAMIDALGDVGSALTDGKPETLSNVYDSLQLRLKYEPHARVVEATISPRVVSVRVRGGSCALTTRLRLAM